MLHEPAPDEVTRPLDRAFMLSYLLGAIVPLIALGVCAQVFVLDQARDPYLSYGFLGGFVSVGVLSLGAFLMLRRVTRRLLARVSGDNARRVRLLSTARTLTSAEHVDDVLMAGVRAARELCGADAAWLLARGKPGDGAPAEWEVQDFAGERASTLDAEIRPALVDWLDADGDAAEHALRATARETVHALRICAPGSAPRILLVATPRSLDPDDEESDTRVLGTLASLTGIALHNAELHEAQRNFFSHVTELLCLALDAHLDRMAGHGQRVAHYANRIGRRMELPEPALSDLHFAALLHDIGMLRIERPAQRSQRSCRDHAALGGKMLSRIRLWQGIAPIVAHHHERIDGQGYPDGLAGDAIPLLARVLAVADAFDAMTSRTSYRETLEPEAAVQELEACAGTQFDPEVVRHCTELVREGIIP